MPENAINTLYAIKRSGMPYYAHTSYASKFYKPIALKIE